MEEISMTELRVMAMEFATSLAKVKTCTDLIETADEILNWLLTDAVIEDDFETEGAAH